VSSGTGPVEPPPGPGSAGSAEPSSHGSAGSAEPGRGSGEQAIELPPDHLKKPRLIKPAEKADPNALYKSGLNAYVVGDMKTALAQFQRAIAASPTFAMAWRGVGMVQERLGDSRAATAAFQRYLMLAPNASDAQAIRGKIGGPR